MTPKKIVTVNERGRRIGESHPEAKLTDHEVDLIRELHEEGMSYREIAAKFDCHYTTVQKFVKCRRRAQIPARTKRLKK